MPSYPDKRYVIHANPADRQVIPAIRAAMNRAGFDRGLARRRSIYRHQPMRGHERQHAGRLRGGGPDQRRAALDRSQPSG